MLNVFFKKIFIHCGPLSLIRTITKMLRGPGITIIYGHRVLTDDVIADPSDPRRIAGQASITEVKAMIEILSKYYSFISIDEAVEQIRNNSIKKDSIVLTFDDGFQDNFVNLLPILKQYNVPAVFYVNSSVINSEKNLWFQSIINFFFAIEADQVYIELSDTHYDLASPQKRFESAFNFMRYLQANHSPSDFNDLINSIAGVKANPTEIDKHMNWEELITLCSESLITLGAHTVNHYPLTLCDEALSNAEIINSKKDLEDKLPIKIEHFSYPRGHEEDFNSLHVEQIKKAGYLSAVSTIRGVNRGGQDLYHIKRVGLPQQVIGKTDELLWYVAGVPQLVSSIKQIFRSTD